MFSTFLCMQLASTCPYIVFNITKVERNKYHYPTASLSPIIIVVIYISWSWGPKYVNR